MSDNKAHSNTATQRAKNRGKEPYPQTTLLRPHTSRTDGSRLRSGAPMRSIKENLINRGPGTSAASSYLLGDAATGRPRLARSTQKGGLLKAIAKAAGDFKFTRKGVVKAAATIGAATASAGASYLAGRKSKE